MTRRIANFVFAAWLGGLLGPAAWAAGPILVDTAQTGQPVLWQGGAVRYNPETTTAGQGGSLGRLTNAEARALLTELFAEWQEVTLNDVATVALTVEEGAGLGDVGVDNVDDHLTYCPPDEICTSEAAPFVLGSARSGESPILFDADGSITDLVQGVGAKDDILGFAGPRVVERVGGLLYITESQAVLNGRFIDCPAGAAASDACQSPEVTLAQFKGAIFHELGHFIGLDHTQVNLSSVIKALNGDDSELEFIPTMLPLFIDGEAQLTPHQDDAVAISSLYPSAAFVDFFCTIRGTIFNEDGVTELQGVNVIARQAGDALGAATSFVSGSYYVGAEDCTAAVGDYEIHGLVPGVPYTLEIEPISQAFRGGSSIEPCDPPLSGFSKQTLAGTFSCPAGGQSVTAGSETGTDIVTNKQATAGTNEGDDAAAGGTSSGGSCALLPRVVGPQGSWWIMGLALPPLLFSRGRRFMKKYLGVVAVLLVASSAGALTVLQLNLEQLVGLADTIFVGEVVAVRDRDGPGGTPVDEVTFQVDQVLKGKAGGKVTFRQLASRAGAEGPTLFPGMPAYRVGDRRIVFLSEAGDLGLTAPIGLQQGLFAIVAAAGGEKQVVNGVDNRGLFVGLAKSPAFKSLRLSRKEQALLKATRGGVDYDGFVSLVEKLAEAQ